MLRLLKSIHTRMPCPSFEFALGRIVSLPVQGSIGLLFNAFAKQQGQVFSADGPHFSSVVTAMPQPSLLPSSSADSISVRQLAHQ